jgi:integrase/recombinase XerD
MGLIEEYLDELRSMGRSEETIRYTRTTLHQADRADQFELGLCLASRNEVQAWLRRPTRGGKRLAPNTLANNFDRLRGFFRWAHGQGKLDWDPMASLTPPGRPKGVPRPVTDDQLALIVASVRHAIRIAALLAAWEGMRAGEIARIDREDITPGGVIVYGKGGRQRVVPTHPLVAAEVASLAPGNLMAQLGVRPAAQAVTSTSGYEFGKLGLDVTLHQLRHWFATTLINAGWSTRVVQVLLGHASVATTEVYTEVAGHNLGQAVAGLPSLGLDGPAT